MDQILKNAVLEFSTCCVRKGEISKEEYISFVDLLFLMLRPEIKSHQRRQLVTQSWSPSLGTHSTSAAVLLYQQCVRITKGRWFGELGTIVEVGTGECLVKLASGKGACYIESEYLALGEVCAKEKKYWYWNLLELTHITEQNENICMLEHSRIL
jgi:hypothetical protein